MNPQAHNHQSSMESMEIESRPVKPYGRTFLYVFNACWLLLIVVLLAMEILKARRQ